MPPFSMGLAMSDRIRLLVASGTNWDFPQRVRDSTAARAFSVIIPEDDSEASLLKSVPEADAILCYESRLPASVIRAARSLKFIQKHGVSCRNIDVAAATERKIPVATMPLLRSITVAEHAMALVLACARKVIPGHLAVAHAVYQEMGLEPVLSSQRQQGANWPKIKGITELHQATVGIVGMGDIGMGIAQRCRSFEMKLCYHQRSPHPKTIEHALGMRYLPLDELLAVSDYVILVVPHTPQTEGLIGARELALMKPSAVLINVGRGALVDEDALAVALQDNRIAMAGLDVYRKEPLPAASALRTLSNVVLLPHTGGGSNRFREVDIPASLGNIERFFSGAGAERIVNPDATGAYIWG